MKRSHDGIRSSLDPWSIQLQLLDKFQGLGQDSLCTDGFFPVRIVWDTARYNNWLRYVSFYNVFHKARLHPAKKYDVCGQYFPSFY